MNKYGQYPWLELQILPLVLFPQEIYLPQPVHRQSNEKLMISTVYNHCVIIGKKGSPLVCALNSEKSTLRLALSQGQGQCAVFMSKMYGLLTKCEVKMAGYWPSSFFVCLWTETESRYINTQKKNEANFKPS